MDHHNTPYCQEAGSLCYGHFIMHCYIYSSPVKHTLEIVASHKQKVHHVKQAQINSRNYDPEISSRYAILHTPLQETFPILSLTY